MRKISDKIWLEIKDFNREAIEDVVRFMVDRPIENAKEKLKNENNSKTEGD